MSHQSPWDDIDMPDFYSKDYVPSHQRSDSKDILNDPRKIKEYLDSKVFMMEDAKKALSMFVYKAIAKRSRSEKVIMLIGETSCGKSHICSVLSEIVPNMVFCDGGSLVPQGFKGGNYITTALSRLDLSNDTPGFIVIDEFNRTLEKGTGFWSDSSLLSELLVLFDDKTAKINVSSDSSKQIFASPANLYWILLGSFSNITDKNSGKSKPIGFNATISNPENSRRPQITKDDVWDYLSEWPELRGRISRIIAIPNNDDRALLRILEDPTVGPVSVLERELGLSINVTKKRIRQIAKDTFAAGTGVRGAKNMLLDEIDEILFNDPDTKEIFIK